jgi:hypothetical protein
MSSSKASSAKPRAAKGTGAKATGKPRAGAVKAADKPARAATAPPRPHGVSAQMVATAAALEKALAAEGGLATLPNESLQKLMAAVVKVYSAKCEAGDRFLPLNATTGRVTPTDIMLTSSQLLRAGNLQVFELGMWQSWTGN